MSEALDVTCFCVCDDRAADATSWVTMFRGVFRMMLGFKRDFRGQVNLINKVTKGVICFASLFVLMSVIVTVISACCV